MNELALPEKKFFLVIFTVPGAHPRGGPEGPRPPLGTYPALYFQGFFRINYVVCIFAACVRMFFFFAMWEGRMSLQHATAADCILKWGAQLLSSNDSVRTILGGARHPRMFG